MLRLIAVDVPCRLCKHTTQFVPHAVSQRASSTATGSRCLRERVRQVAMAAGAAAFSHHWKGNGACCLGGDGPTVTDCARCNLLTGTSRPLEAAGVQSMSTRENAHAKTLAPRHAASGAAPAMFALGQTLAAAASCEPAQLAGEVISGVGLGRSPAARSFRPASRRGGRGRMFSAADSPHDLIGPLAERLQTLPTPWPPPPAAPSPAREPRTASDLAAAPAARCAGCDAVLALPPPPTAATAWLAVVQMSVPRLCSCPADGEGARQGAA